MARDADAHGLCRDCLAEWTAAAETAPPPRPGTVPCPQCGSPRTLVHPELTSLHIAHIDCDAFYAEVEKRDNPALADKPVIIGGGRRGVVSTACYIARLYGVRSAMPMFKAQKACPQAVVIHPDMAKYAAIGREVRRLMQATTPLVEPISIDEAFLDLGGTNRLHGGSPARTLAALVRRIRRRIGIGVSVGLAGNKFLAKMASELDKPRGFAVIGRADAATFLAPLPVTAIHGVGASLGRRLHDRGIVSIADLRRHDPAWLQAHFGAMGRVLHDRAHGRDSRPVKSERAVKSVSCETTFDADTGDLEQLRHHLWPLCEKLSRRLKRSRLAGRCLVLKLKTDAHRTLNRSQRLTNATNLAEVMYRASLPLLEKIPAGGQQYRLIGVGVTDLTDGAGADPLDLGDPELARQARIERALDRVRDKLGEGAIARGRGWTRRERTAKNTGTHANASTHANAGAQGNIGTQGNTEWLKK